MQECYDDVKQENDERKSTGDSAEEHGRPEADHRSSERAGRGHTVLCVSSLSSMSARRLQLECVDGALQQQQEEEEEEEEDAVQLVVRCVRRPARLEEAEQRLGHTGEYGPPRSEGVSSPRSPDNLLCSLKLWRISNWEVTVMWRCWWWVSKSEAKWR